MRLRKGTEPRATLRRASLRSLTLLVFSILVCGCYSRVDEIRMRIDKQEKGALVVFVSAPVSTDDPGAGEDEFLSKEDLQESSGYKELNSFIEQLTQCAITNRLYQRRTRIKLDLRAPFQDVDDLNSILSCGAQQFERPVVSFERHDGFLWNTYITQFEITQRTGRCGGEDDCTDS